MAKILIAPIFDFETPEGPSDQFKAIQNDMDAQGWRGRGSTFELPIRGEHGAGGNPEGDGTSKPIDTLHDAGKRSFKIAGPRDVTGKGSTAIGGRK